MAHINFFSQHTIKKMDGLVLQKEMEQFKLMVEKITNDFLEEGFEETDIKAYLDFRMKKTMEDRCFDKPRFNNHQLIK